jgi:hypothetical protein
MLPKTGKDIRSHNQLETAYARAIADALRAELGQSHRATKTVMRWTGASDRTAKNWLNGACGPSGHHLLLLSRESDAVLATVLSLAGRHRHMVGAEILSIREQLFAAIALIDALIPPAGS